MGRRPDAPAIQRLKGNPGRRPIADAAAEITTIEAASTAPAWLKDEAKAIWDRLAPDLRTLNLMHRVDALTFGRYCEWFALWLKARRRLGDGDLVVTTASEHVTMDRLDKNLHACLLIEKRLLDTEDRFGLNPANRQRIFAQRAAAGAAGGLFDPAPGDAPAQPGEPEGREVASVGFLNA